MISEIGFEEIYKVWQDYLWPHRTSKIESHSAMLFLSGYDLNNYKFQATHLAYKVDGEIVGVNSGHMCGDYSYRSRGLYVFPKYRKHGIGKDLLLATIDRANNENASFIWSFPRKDSWGTYKSAGFEVVTEWKESETGINAYCNKLLQ